MQGSLNTETGGETQNTTQNPQANTGGSGLAASTSTLQSGTVNLLTGTNGVTLNPTALPGVSLNGATTVSKPAPVIAVKHHHTSAILLAVVIVVFLVAMATFWKTTLAAKSTTE